MFPSSDSTLAAGNETIVFCFTHVVIEAFTAMDKDMCIVNRFAFIKKSIVYWYYNGAYVQITKCNFCIFIVPL